MNKNIEGNKDLKTVQDKGSVLKRFVIPQADIDRLEEARKSLCELFCNKSGFLDILTHVTPAMYEITHRKYEEVV